MKRIKLMADYGMAMLWHVGGPEVGAIDPDDLPLSLGLRHGLRKWAGWYDGTLDQESPSDSGFPSPAKAEAFELEGRRLWQQLRSELGSEFNVAYFSEAEGRLIEEP